MPDEYVKVDFQEFINNFGMDLVVNNAPKILYPKKDKEHEAYNFLIMFLFLTGGLLIYIAISIIFMEIWFSLSLFITIIAAISVLDIIFILIYVKSSVFVRPIECWIEIYKGKSQNTKEYYCFSYYPIFSGKCHPNKAKDVIYKLYREQVLENLIDITQIEFYFKLNKNSSEEIDPIGFFFQYGEGKSFINPDIDRNQWKFFPHAKLEKENFISVANWDHQFEWRDDLQLDFDKLHQYAPWIIKSWSKLNIKPLTEDFKEKTYKNKDAHQDIVIINKAIEEILGNNPILNKLRDVKEHIPEFKIYFRDLS